VISVSDDDPGSLFPNGAGSRFGGRDVDFSESIFEEARLSGSLSGAINFEKASLRGTRFVNGSLENAWFIQSHLDGAIFLNFRVISATTSGSATMSGALLSSSQFPDSFLALARQRGAIVCNALPFVIEAPEPYGIFFVNPSVFETTAGLDEAKRVVAREVWRSKCSGFRRMPDEEIDRLLTALTGEDAASPWATYEVSEVQIADILRRSGISVPRNPH
jgi:hypothetical protein